jgi:hypothetical protein
MDLVSDRCSGLVQAGEVESRGLQGPARRAVPARETAPYILMRIDADRHAECVRLPDHGTKVLQVLLVIDAGTGMLHGLPWHEEAQERESPLVQPGEMLVSLIEREGAADERDSTMIEESLA